jgi:hypothetical protein
MEGGCRRRRGIYVVREKLTGNSVGKERGKRKSKGKLKNNMALK